jgi:hypothetical protein
MKFDRPPKVQTLANAHLPALLAVALLASCASNSRGFAESGRAPPGYEPFNCFESAFEFRPGTAI